MFKKKLAALFLAITLIPSTVFAAGATTSTATQANIKVQYNASAIAFPDQKPLILNQRTLVPIRPIAEALGFQVGWDEKTRTVSVEKGNNKVSLVVSQKIAKRNNETITLDVPAQIINKRTVVPVRFIAEALNYEVNWEAKTQTVAITDKAAAPAAAETTPAATDTASSQQDTSKLTEADLIDEETVFGRSVQLGKTGIYRVSGQVEPGAKVTLEIDKEYDVQTESDGSFEFTVPVSGAYEEYTLIAVKDNEFEKFEGEFESR
ncbi:copper amine oxidase N-terminal domain-containing protein [Brevibacillus fulvus]|uniref:Copper amine oxidase-like N-terminal domain-containing protein n=1 Tax=Brevibacillus fulvus TaxID=1125967 RepID=A0A938XUX8_9BACL|nr:copper amine oxidase N-terminal domain-containing protein [Brevibacillus fulvus]MBM7588431.1 hypothetical protein [Brevibacillus fulvus]